MHFKRRRGHLVAGVEEIGLFMRTSRPRYVAKLLSARYKVNTRSTTKPSLDGHLGKELFSGNMSLLPIRFVWNTLACAMNEFISRTVLDWGHHIHSVNTDGVPSCARKQNSRWSEDVFRVPPLLAALPSLFQQSFPRSLICWPSPLLTEAGPAAPCPSARSRGGLREEWSWSSVMRLCSTVH